MNDRLEKRNGEGSRTRTAIMDRYAHLLPKLKGHDLGTLTSKWPSSTTTYAQPIAAMMSAARSTPNPTFQSSMAFRKMGEASGLPSNEFTPFRPRHKRRKWEESEVIEEAPAATESENDNLSFAPISKRSRFEFDASPAQTPKRATSTMIMSTTQNSILSVLTTPLIDRRVGSILSRSHLAASLLEASERSMTPHSILKVKGANLSSLQSDSPLSTLFTASRRRTITMEDEEEECDDNWLVKHRQAASASRESTPGKSLRFNVPKRLPPPEIVTPDESSCEPSIVSAEVSQEISPEISPAKQVSPVKQVQEKVEPPPQRRPEDDDSIVLVSSEDDEVDELDQEEEEESQADSEIEELYVEDDDDQEVESEVEEVDNEEEAYQSFSSPEVSAKNVVDHSMYGPHETLPVDVDLARNLATQDSDSSLNQTPKVGERSFVSGRAENERVAETTMYGPDVTMAVDVDLARILASQDSETNVSQNVTTFGAEMDQSVVSSGNSNKGSNVTMYGHDETIPVDVSFVRRLAQRDAEEELEEDSFCVPKTPRSVDRSAIFGRSTSGDRVSDATMYGSDGTMPVDVSFVRHLAKNDAEEEEMETEQTSYSGGVSIVDLDHAETNKTDSSISQMTVSDTFSMNRFSFSEPKELVIQKSGPETEEVTEANRSGEFKFEEPQNISVAEPKQKIDIKSPESSILVLDSTQEVAEIDLVKTLAQKDLAATPGKSFSTSLSNLEPVFEEEDSGEITFKATPKTVPESAKKRKPRFSESFSASASQLGSILEEVSTPTSFFLGKDERFRTKPLSVDSPSSRIRSTSVTHASPSVKRRSRSSQSASDVSGLAPSTIQHEEESKLKSEEKKVEEEKVEEKFSSQIQETEEEELTQIVDVADEPKKIEEPVEAEPTKESTEANISEQTAEVLSLPECATELEPFSQTQAPPEKVKTPTKAQATPEKVKTPVKTQASPEKVKTEVSPEKVKTPVKTQASPEKVKIEVSLEKVKTPVKTQASPEKVKTPTKAQATPEKVKTPTKAKGTPEKVTEVSPKIVNSSRTRTRSKMSESETELTKQIRLPATSDNTDGSQEKTSAGKISTSVLESTPSKSEVASQPRLTRKSSASVSHASPLIVEGSRRRTRSTLSESEPEPLKGATPSRRSRKVKKEEEQKPSEDKPDESTTIIESSKRKRTKSDQENESSPARKSSRLEERKKSVESPKPVSIDSPKKMTPVKPESAPSTPEQKDDETAVPKSETRRMTRRASASQPSPAEAEVSTRRRSKASLSDTDIEPLKSTPGRRTRKSETEEVVGVSQISAPASPLTRTPGRRGKSAALSVTQLSPIPEKSKTDDLTKSDDENPVVATEPSSTPSRILRRSSVASPAILDLPKRTRRSSKTEATNVILESETPSTPKVTSRSTRRSSSDVTPIVPVDVPVKRTRSVVKPKTPADPENVTPEKAARATPSRRVSAKAASHQEEVKESRRTTRSSSSHEMPQASGSTPRKSVNATSSKTRKSIMISDPFSPVVGPEVEEELKAGEQKPKRKYVVRKSAKSYKLV